MRHIILIFILLVISFTTKADEITYNFDYSLNDETSDCNDLPDPFEPVNRKIFYFNGFLDYIILKPIAKLYGRVIPDSAKNGIGNVVDNVYEPLTTVNYGLQGNLDKVLRSFWKFTVNITFGIGGINDLGSSFGLNHKPQTFGATLAHYGVETGPYVVIPILGSTNTRDMWDVIVLDSALNPLRIKLPQKANNVYSVVRIVHKRNEIMPFTDYITRSSTDPYAAIRSSLYQRRETNVSYPAGYKCGVRPSKK